jgi:Rrf2 family protein
MMKVTAQEEYGLRCLLQLARKSATDVPVTVREIAAGEGLSTAYAEKLLRILSRAGLAESIRGTRGGYRISRSPNSVTMGEAVRALGGLLSPAAICSRFTGKQDCCVHARECGLRSVWSLLSVHIEYLLDRVSLATLLKDEQSVLDVLGEAGIALVRPSSRSSPIDTPGEA